MKISENYPQFESMRALIVVSGWHDAIFYIANKGKIEKTGEFKLLNPRYSDKEGFFESSGGGRLFSSGSVLEVDKIEYRHRFLREVDKILTSLVAREEIDEIYLFSPGFTKNELIKLMPKEDKKKIAHIFTGNFTHLHPFTILEMIKRSRIIGWNVPLREEARKILEKPKILKKQKK